MQTFIKIKIFELDNFYKIIHDWSLIAIIEEYFHVISKNVIINNVAKWKYTRSILYKCRVTNFKIKRF